MIKIEEKQNLAEAWFKTLRDNICQEFEKIEEEFLATKNITSEEVFLTKNAAIKNSNYETSAPKFSTPQKFLRKQWNRDTADGSKGGGGEMSAMKGNVFEKVGVNISTVFGEFSPEFRKQIQGAENDGKFFATGISLVAHMASPLVPAVHMNTRFICTKKSWFGGGADLNPMFESAEDTANFHQAFKTACNKYDASLTAEELAQVLKNSAGNEFGDKFSHENSSYNKFKKWCDEYFFIKHRGVARGVGGIFYDYLNSENSSKENQLSSSNSVENFTKDLNFTKNVGLAFLEIFPQLVRRNMLKCWTEEQREHQLKKRGLYAEFNLVYDRGTKFGLMTGGNVEAILMSLPPVAKWD